MDAMFQNDELERWLTRNQLKAQWTNGVYERIADGNVPTYSDEAMPVLKSCRIWQLKPGAAAWKDIVTFGRPLPEPKMEDYAVVYDGQLDTNDLEAIYDKFTERRPPSGFSGRPMSVSDLVELYDGNGGNLYYLDRTCFRPVKFPGLEQDCGMNMTL
jgi:hypothetical protein